MRQLRSRPQGQAGLGLQALFFFPKKNTGSERRCEALRAGSSARIAFLHFLHGRCLLSWTLHGASELGIKTGFSPIEAVHLTILYETEFTYTAKTFVSNLRLN
jgi:hypothetical protein